MNWIIAIMICALIGCIIGYTNTGKKEDAIGGAITGGLGCGYVIFQIALFLIGIFILFKVGGWLFE